MATRISKYRAKITVKQDDEKPVSREVLAKAIVDMSEAATRLTSSGLNRKAVIILLSESSGVNRTDIKHVLDCMESLQTTYLK